MSRHATLLLTTFCLVACAESTESPRGSSIDTGGDGGANGGVSASGASSGDAPNGGSAGTSVIVTDGGASGASGGNERDPKTCEEAEKFRTYLGCRFFPTVLGNVVNPEFDYAVVVANTSDEAADVHVEGPDGFVADQSVGAHGLSTIYLPWVTELKGPSLAATCTSAAFTGSVLAPGGAYRLTSTRPIAAYQFSPLEFRAAGGPAGKQWSCQPGTSPACSCNSYSNDASLLLPANALTSNYVAFTWRDQGNPNRSKSAVVTVTALEDGTEVAVRVGLGGEILAGPDGSGITQTAANQILRFTLDAGDVAELVAAAGTDLSGTQVQANVPIQLLAGSPSATSPSDSVNAADHMEEVVFPAESVGRDYVVTVPTGPYGAPVRHVVRLYGHAVATSLDYFPAAPAGAPALLMPGEAVEFEAAEDFQVQGSEPFAVGSFLVGGALLDPDAPPLNSAGDPSQSFATTIAQYRDKYVFLAPIDYEDNFVDIVAPSGATVTLDGTPLDPAQATPLSGRADDGTTPQSFDVYRVPLDAGPRFQGAHEMTSTVPVGIQVVGYGRFTSYQYPGGLNLNLISDPPVMIPPR